MNKLDYEKKLCSILQVDIFSELYNFWRIVEESEYDYKIFISKKCFVLYKAFMPIFDFDSYNNCVRMTDTAIPIYKPYMKNSTVLVVDDVFIHGRAAVKVNAEIGDRVRKIKYYTFAKNNNSEEPQDTSIQRIREENAISKNVNNTMTYMEKLNKAILDMQGSFVEGYLNCGEYQWKRISDLIMKSLWGINMPYASYLPIVVMNDKDRFCNLESKNQFVNYTSHSQKELNQYFSYYISTNENKEEKEAIIHYCFVISKNDFMGNCKVIPMVFFDCENTSIDKKFIFDGFNIIYGNESSELWNYFVKTGRNDQGMVSSLKYLIFSVGYLALKKFLLCNGINEKEYYIDDTNAIYSFGAGIDKYLSILMKNSRLEMLEQLEKLKIKCLSDRNKKVGYGEREILLAGLKESYIRMKNCSIEKDSPSIVDVLQRYFKFNNIYNEHNFYKFRPQKKRYVTGLKFSEIKEFLNKKNFESKDIILGLMYQYNLGAATIDFLYDYDRRGNIVGINMYWRAGEQSYKCISESYVLIVYFKNLYNTIFADKIARFLYDILLEVATENYRLCKIPFRTEDLERYCNIGDNVYNAFDIKRYCQKKEYKFLGYIAEQMQQYVLRGHLQEINNNDKLAFKKNLFEFMEAHTDEEVLRNCEKILRSERDV